VRQLPSAAAATTAVHDREVAAAFVDVGSAATVAAAWLRPSPTQPAGIATANRGSASRQAGT
jgi:hypothetical protein